MKRDDKTECLVFWYDMPRITGQNKPIKLHNQYFGRLIVWVAEGSEQLLTVLTTYDMVFVWTQTRLEGSTSDFYCLSSDLRWESGKWARDAL